MKIKLLMCAGMLSISCSSFAEMTGSLVLSDVKPLGDVRVSMQRMLKSTDDRYFLSLYAGVWNPHATLTDLIENKTVDLKGLQKGDQLILKSVDSEVDQNENGLYQLSGALNANTGTMKALLVAGQNTLAKTLQFEPAIKVVNKPNFVFKFYGANAPNQAYAKIINRVDVMNKATNALTQILTGFTAYPNSIGYMDINFDGYYDVILSDVSNGLKVEDKHFIYWMFNPKTQNFQRSPQLEKIVGFPSLHGEKQQIDFGNGQLYQVENGLLNRVE